MASRPSVVFDTNILVSSLWSGPPWQVVRLWRDRKLWLLISSAVLREYLSVLSRFVTSADLKAWAELLTDPARSIRVDPQETIDLITLDPPDNRFLECAIAGAADAIVSGDRHLLSLKSFRDIPILNPRAFLHWCL